MDDAKRNARVVLKVEELPGEVRDLGAPAAEETHGGAVMLPAAQKIREAVWRGGAQIVDGKSNTMVTGE